MQKLIPLALVAALVMWACGGKPAQEAESTASVTYSHNTGMSVTHEVKDYAAWLKVYEKDSDPNERISLYVSLDNPNMVTVFMWTTSHEDARKLAASEGLKKSMSDAGVVSEPTFTYFDLKYSNTAPSDKKYRVLVKHEVSDFDAWKKIFDADEPRRTEAGLELRGLSTDADNPRIVGIMFATDDPEKAKGMMGSDDLKAKMKEAGVVSEPTVTVLVIPQTM